jgi:4-hydroxythreonine-4-phosphate dehydrogenase
MHHTLKPLAVTQGDPAGIGLEITLKVWLERKKEPVRPFFLISDPDFVEQTARMLDFPVPIKRVDPNSAWSTFDSALPIVPLKQTIHVDRLGVPNRSNASAIQESIVQAVTMVQTEKAAALVTNPIAKHILASPDFPYAGHTDYLAALAHSGSGSPAKPIMLLWSPQLAVVPVTGHQSLRSVSDSLSQDKIQQIAQGVAHDLFRLFNISSPRIAITGLNPHAGEEGLLGDEEIRIIIPAIAYLKEKGFHVTGPHSADTLFHHEARKHYDVAIAMYHDQALIPIKTLAFGQSVNVTLGLPFVRTSPDHGTAFPIAGKGIASCISLRSALRLAERLADHLQRNSE